MAPLIDFPNWIGLLANCCYFKVELLSPRYMNKVHHIGRVLLFEHLLNYKLPKRFSAVRQLPILQCVIYHGTASASDPFSLLSFVTAHCLEVLLLNIKFVSIALLQNSLCFSSHFLKVKEGGGGGSKLNVCSRSEWIIISHCETAWRRNAFFLIINCFPVEHSSFSWDVLSFRINNAHLQLYIINI